MNKEDSNSNSKETRERCGREGCGRDDQGEVNSGMFVFSSGNTAVIPVATILCVSFVSLRIQHSGAFRVRKMVPGISDP